MTDTVRHWWPSAVFAAAALAVGVVVADDGYLVAALVLGGVLLAAAWWVSPLRGRGSTTRAQADEGGTEAVVVYWRPGCIHSERLRAGLRRSRGVTWVNIWEDPAAAAFVRRHNDGDEVVPTVVMDSGVWTNPDPRQVRRAARRAASRLRG